MSRCWLALAAERPGAADAAAPVHDPAGAPAGWLVAWWRRSKPVRGALRIDPRVADPAGAEAWVSLVLPPPGARPPFDDLAIQHARREVLARPPLAAVSTLLADDSHFAGALTAARGADAQRLADDPFARVFPARILRVGAGVIGAPAPPAGPVIERYGSAQPWPWDRFEG